ncbi:MAG TPA: DUF2059 domain-containing protein [Longimicrobiaceae bacterium]|nr:DUF2059 domain-containing protein [Longimicrobiaceae bacterium]
MKRLLPLLVLVLACAAPSAAQEATPARLRAASELVDAMNMQKIMGETAEATLRSQMQGNPMMAQFEDIMREFMAKALNWEEIRGDFVRIYAETYTEDELRQLRAFYQTPLGQRLLATQAVIAGKSTEVSNRRMQQFLPEMQQRIMQRMVQSSDTTSRP